MFLWIDLDCFELSWQIPQSCGTPPPGTRREKYHNTQVMLLSLGVPGPVISHQVNERDCPLPWEQV